MTNLKKEIKNLRKVYNTIADSWTNLRNKPEQEVIKFAKNKKGLILDFGCGNCRNSLPFLENNCKCIGLDFSISMIKQAKKYLKKRNFKMNFILGDISTLPFKDKSFDHVIYTRTLHHLPSKEMRLKSLRETKRICKKNILISVWKGKSEDRQVEWNYHGKKLKRFYHTYTINELKFDLKSVNMKPKKIWEDKKGFWKNIWCEI